MAGGSYPHSWTREGFLGDAVVTQRPHPIIAYTEVTGAHAPRRIDLTAIKALDATDSAELPTVFARSRNELTLAVSARTEPTPFVWRNAEYDEVHFVQEGEFDYVTDWGTLTAKPGDFVFLPRAASYRVVPTTTSALRVIIETPEAIALNPQAVPGMINPARSVSRPDATRTSDASGETTLLIRAADGITRFTMPEDPLALTAIVSGQAPVWKVNLAEVQPVTYLPLGGPPSHFAETPTKDLLLYTMSARPGGRPPQHHNADYDELVFYFRGPGPYGGLTEPGLGFWIPKAVAHWGPSEDVEGGYLAWLLESGGTIRLTPEGLAASELMETSYFHPLRSGGSPEQAGPQSHLS
ncbi:homogentisate 1,2-dioxygenase [Lentzea xinjiangensis]|uniref:Homogentisate 1,2-dioxygenase n=1 Tax=Lentzea xinjiangensis TaxID=402600 RepID=A0A1H9NIE2_9PSEU|nr:homogentisate 1,2-dioxygenase [Lentzea xinjiangensis]